MHERAAPVATEGAECRTGPPETFWAPPWEERVAEQEADEALRALFEALIDADADCLIDGWDALELAGRAFRSGVTAVSAAAWVREAVEAAARSAVGGPLPPSQRPAGPQPDHAPGRCDD
jgi:hypothetical protein